jgi:hypothetical protein
VYGTVAAAHLSLVSIRPGKFADVQKGVF